MKNKKKVSIIAVIILLLAIIVSVYFVLTTEDSQTSLNLLERQWIENNKNNLIDFSVVSEVPILSNNGDGVIIEFLDSLKEETELSFNMIPYKSGDEEKKYDIYIKLVDEIKDNHILIHEDNYVVVTKENQKLNLSDFEGLTIGVLESELENINKNMTGVSVNFKTFTSKEELILNYTEELDGIVLLKTTDLNLILNNEYTISYNISDYTKSYVIELGEEQRLNDILKKYYNNWYSRNYVDSFGQNFFDNYVTINDISDSSAVNFRSKRYVYGYVENGPFDTIFDSKLAGINNQFLKSFSNYTNSEISYKSYNSLEELVNDFNNGNIDFFYNFGHEFDYSVDVINTISLYDNKLVVLSAVDNISSYSSIKSLEIASTIKDSYAFKYLNDFGVSTKPYNNIETLIDEQDSYLVMDLQNYNYYTSDLVNYVIIDYIDIVDNSMVIRNIKENEMFIDLFGLYTSYVDSSLVVNLGIEEVMNVNVVPYIIKNVAIILGTLVGTLLIVLLIVKIKPKAKTGFTKEDKIKFTDALTSLRNRDYLNKSIDKWDNSEVYPQTIIMLDLKNIAYINDNYGHSEGDEVIKQAASILISNQMEKTDIVRTSGNEFLVYLVGYTEKQVITYIRKLNKELKELKHGFGCAIGYSMITDAIKTVDDAINEASLDMRNNKEDLSE